VFLEAIETKTALASEMEVERFEERSRGREEGSYVKNKNKEV
jgi:hypothetical protein